MTEFLILVLFALAAVLWHRDRRLRQLIDEQNARIASLTQRIWNLESHGVAAAAPPAAPHAAPAPAPPQPLPSLPLPAFAVAPPPPLPVAPPPPLPSMPMPPMPAMAPSPPPPAFVPAEPRPSWRDQFKGEEWEAILGGSILNKIGALILVIAIALLLKLSLEQLGPLGKIAVGALTGAFILGAGVWIERKPKWRIFANGLLSAGWAILYFTSFATHGIPESRIFESATVGLIVMLAVAGVMVAHSLRYDSQWVTGLAFFAAFAALQIDRGSVYSLAASAILAAGLLAVCYRRDWQTLALCGIGLAYATVAFVVNPPIFWNGIGQPVLWIYWLLFEAFDLALEYRAGSRRTAMRQIHFLLNSFAFIGASLLATPPKTQPEHYSAFLGLATMGFTASFLLRFRQNPQAMAEHPLLGGLTPSGLSLTATTVLASFAILQRFEKLSATLAFLILGEVLFLFAWRIAQEYPRHLALAVQVFTFLKLIAFDVFANGTITWMDRKIAAASPLLLLIAAVYYFNRSIALGLLAPIYTWMASTAVFLTIGHEAPEEYACALWAVLAAVLFEAGLRLRHSEFRYQAYAAVAVSSSLAALFLAFGPKPIPWGAWALSAAALAAITWRARQTLAADLRERSIVLPVLPVLATGSLACLGWAATPSTLVAPVWGLTALLLVELAAAIEYPALRNSAIALAMLSFGRLFLSNFAISGRTGPLSHRVLTVAPFLAYYYYLWSRTRFRLFLWAPPILMLFLVRFEIGRVYTAAGITFACLALLAIGFQRSIVDLRWQAYLGAIYAFFRSWAYSFAVPGQLMGIPLRVISASLVVTGFFAAQRLISRDAPTQIDRWARPAFPLLGAILMAGMLYHEVSGTVLTAAWSVEGAALLIAGFVLGERVMRFSGLGLFLFCIGKLFFYDLSSLEGIPRILSFIVLGVLLMGASWLYTRFREQLKRHL